MTTNIFHRAFTLPLATMLLAVTACDDPAIVEEEHFDVEGFALMEGDTQLYRYVLDDGAPPELTLLQRVHEVTFIPLDHDGNPLPEEEGEHEDDEHELQITIDDTTVLSWTPEAHGDEDPFIVFPGELTGLSEGTTTMTVCVPHGGHCDFTTDVTVNVTAP